MVVEVQAALGMTIEVLGCAMRCLRIPDTPASAPCVPLIPSDWQSEAGPAQSCQQPAEAGAEAEAWLVQQQSVAALWQLAKTTQLSRKGHLVIAGLHS